MIGIVEEDGVTIVNTLTIILIPSSYSTIITNISQLSNFNQSIIKTVSEYKYKDYGQVIDTKGISTNPLSLNLYAYCLDNPIMYVDPKGNNPILL